MITHIKIQNFAIIENIDVDFQPGLTIMTGETGAGKSIIIEAISLALGSRADTAFVRTGKSKAVIQLVVNIDQEELIITREVSATGKSLCKVNDEIVTLGRLTQLCKKIADIHGQYDHQSLLNPENHIQLIDLYDAAAILPLKKEVAELYEGYRGFTGQLMNLNRTTAERARKMDFMKFELEEIQDATLIPGEDTALEKQILLLQNGEKIFQNLSQSYNALYEQSPSSVDSLGKTVKLLEEVAPYSPDIEAIKEALSDCYYKIEDLSHDLRRLRDGTSFSATDLDDAIIRMNTIDKMKSKYGQSIEEILTYKDSLLADLDKIENLDALKETITKELKAYEEKLGIASIALSKLRKASAKKLEKLIDKELAELNFHNASISVHFETLRANGAPQYTNNGTDQVEFLIVTNKGDSPKPLAKIASGGEISRVMLAFKRVIGDYDKIPTMIFDEIDSGISGITATIVGKKLLQIAETHQVICITHLPQIAAYGHHHYQIQKHTDDASTHTDIALLSPKEKIQEIARLLGGMTITETTLKSAKELIEMSK
ncbi:MAG: DNA repair protein RecN [Anaerovorax sp.]